MAISFIINNIEFKLKGRYKIKNWIKKIVEDNNKRAGALTIILTNDEFILDTNKKYLNHNYYTDIITFDYSEGRVISGDILISIETVKSNSEKYKTKFDQELMRVIIHGVLHLLGYTDKSRKDRLEMRAEEDGALEILMKL